MVTKHICDCVTLRLPENLLRRVARDKNITYLMMFMRIRCKRPQKALSTGGCHGVKVTECACYRVTDPCSPGGTAARRS